jgi:predicted phosphodiesterase
VTEVGTRVGLFTDVHGSTRTLSRALNRCRGEGVETIALLGDLFDRPEQADACVLTLAGWQVVGVYGNHEREVALAAAAGELDLLERTIEVLTALQEHLLIDDVCLTHHAEQWGRDDMLARVLGRQPAGAVSTEQAWVTFTGHTHFRQARDERGPLDVSRGTLVLDPNRRYLINPGALLTGQFAIWDRVRRTVRFLHLEG